MIHENKNFIDYLPTAKQVASSLGMAAMLLATACGMVEHSDREAQRAAVMLQPAYATIAPLMNNLQANTYNDQSIRRSGKEEIHHAAATYGAVKRSHSVSGSI